MYSKIVMAVWLSFMLLSCRNGYRIEGVVDSVANGDMVVLQKQQGISFVGIDSTYIRNGRFSFKGRQDTATMAMISISGKDRLPFAPLLFILENGRLNAVIDTLSTISGTAMNNRFQAYVDRQACLAMEMGELERQYMMNSQESVWADSLSSRFQQRILDCESRQKALLYRYILDNTDNISGIYLFIQNSFLFSPDEQQRIISGGDRLFQSNPAVRTVSRMLSMNKKVAPGMSYVDLKMNSPEGRRVALSDYVGKGKYVLIGFWSSWCNPCRNQIPELKAIYDRFKNKNFEMVGVSFDIDPDEWSRYIEEMKLEWPQMSDFKGYDSDAIMQYAIQGIPHTVLVSPQGTIVAKDLKGEELNNLLHRLLK